jgi:hypothetical protein
MLASVRHNLGPSRAASNFSRTYLYTFDPNRRTHINDPCRPSASENMALAFLLDRWTSRAEAEARALARARARARVRHLRLWDCGAGRLRLDEMKWNCWFFIVRIA